MSTKLVDNKRRNHAEKVLRTASKKTKNEAEASATAVKAQIKKNIDPSLREQYEVIRKDLLKLRDDLAKGYDLAKTMVEKKGFVKQLLSVK